ncbi:MAG TPA: hypothetical protein VJW73_13550 [Gemmatimonadaceae bacterium]|nr:hypothetical protein [Gemmatimonadaceae bacterium]
MEHELIQELMVFVGLMAALGSFTKIVLSIINRRKPLAGPAVPALEEISQRLGRMEQAIDATAVEVERISEAQRFTTKLLVERGHQAPMEPGRARTVTPH